MRKKYKYNFSVIIPIYNVEEYLEDAIESVIHQTLDFKENIEIILVNDGSPDNSEEICLKYVNLYPKNIKYIKQKNSGVSAARNNGYEQSNGKYINFLDSDDKWENNAFEKALKMFEENLDVDIIGVRQKFFEAISTYPSLDFKFNKDKVVSIFENYNHIQLSVTSGFIRASSIGNIRFDSKVKYSEDAKFLNEIIIKHGKLGIIASSLHYYRKRFSENSAIQVKNTKDDWYLITPLKCYKHAFDLSKKIFGYVIPYFQYYVAYDYQWRIKDKIPECINNKKIKRYLKITQKLFEEIDDNIFLEQDRIPSEYKIKALSIKYNKEINKGFKYFHHSLYFNGHSILDFKNSNHLKVNIINFKKNQIEIRGIVNLPLVKKDYQLSAIINNTKKIPIKLVKTKINTRKSFNKAFISNYGFIINIPLNDFKSLYFELTYKNLYKTKIYFSTGLNAKINVHSKNYYTYDNLIYYHNNGRLKRKKSSLKNKIFFEIRFINNLIKDRRFKIMVFRTAYHIMKKFNHKQIWLISDRTISANDNGMHFFKYICKQKNPDIKPYFVISKDSKEYQKMKAIGKTLCYNSLKYKLYFLLASKIISSQADPWVTNPFGHSYKYYSDLYNSDFIFLQHGVTKNDMSEWLNCYEKNIKVFVTTSIKEYESIVNGNYGFKDDVVKLTGMPRYDNLCDDKQKVIAIMPTWRLSIASNINKDGYRPYSASFKDSNYFKFYNNLINDNKLLDIMNEYGYKGVFVSHPSHIENATDFDSNSVFTVIKNSPDYQKIFSIASLLITDYSSVLFDFAYIKKPVLYTQFDKKEFYKKHLCQKGYFNDEIDGFGPVTFNYDDTIKHIIEFIKNDCKIEDKYIERINKFYKYFDKSNCKRVYESILNINY